MSIMANSLDDPRFSDFTIKCGGHSIAVHRVMLDAASSVLAKACSGEFKASIGLLRSTATID